MRRLNNPSATLFGFAGENKTQASYILTLASPKIDDDDEVQLRTLPWYLISGSHYCNPSMWLLMQCRHS